MPRGDRTGPMGQGPMTGRRMGYCTGADVPGYASAPGRGMGFGGGGGWGGGGRGHRNMFYATGLYGWQRAGAVPPIPPVPASVSREDEIEALKRQADYFGSQLEVIRKRIEELQKED